MLSRTADNLFWTGRYMERADFLARILDAALRLAALPAEPTAETRRLGQRARLGRRRQTPSTPAPRAPPSDTVRDFLAFEPGQPVLDPLLPDHGPRQRAARCAPP